jgi:parallel beta-helix repeat protein
MTAAAPGGAAIGVKREKGNYMKRFSGVLCALFACALTVGASSAFAGTTRIVGNNPLTCANAAYSTIQSAVAAAAPGDTIKVCPGTYVEQVSIPAGKNNLTIVSAQHWLAIIQAPAAMTTPKAIVRVNGAHGVTIKDFIIEGPGGGACDSLESGVRIDAGGSATLLSNHIAHIRDQPFGGCQNGVGIQAGRSADATTGTVVARGNRIDDFQKNGITVSGGGSQGTLQSNTIVGAGPTAVIAQNGIQFSSGATGNATQNDVSGAVYSPGTTTSTGILLFGPIGPVTVAKNTLHNNDVGAYVFGADSKTKVDKNTITSSTWDGISLDTSTASKVTNNTTNGGTQGIGLYGTTNALIEGNRAVNNSTYGFYAGPDTSANMFLSNTASANHALNCRDDSIGVVSFGTANTWRRNSGAGSSPLGLCR